MTYVTRLTRCVLLVAVVGPCLANRSLAVNRFSEEGILEVMQRVNGYTRANPYRETDRNWVRATWYTGVMEAYHATGDRAYLDQARQWAEKHQWQVGEERSGFNRLFCTMTWAELYLLAPDPKKIAPTIDGLNAGTPADLVVFDLHEALASLDRIIGLTVKPDILDEIFGRFCIGK